MRAWSSLLALLLLSPGCAALAPPPDWSEYSGKDLCAAVGSWRDVAETHRDGVRVLLERGQVRKEWARTILNGDLGVGMTTCEVMAAWGPPSNQRRSRHSWGTHDQMIFRESRAVPARQVYLKSGKVSSWRD